MLYELSTTEGSDKVVVHSCLSFPTPDSRRCKTGEEQWLSGWAESMLARSKPSNVNNQTPTCHNLLCCDNVCSPGCRADCTINLVDGHFSRLEFFCMSGCQ